LVKIDGIMALMEFVFYARPHPDLLPRGEGTAIERFLVYERVSGKSNGQMFTKAVDISPTPRGGGRFFKPICVLGQPSS
jgi:hypothetical protein